MKLRDQIKYRSKMAESMFASGKDFWKQGKKYKYIDGRKIR